MREYCEWHCPQGHDAPKFKLKTGARRQKELQPVIPEHIEAGATIFINKLKPYEGLGADYQTAVINHAVECLNGNVHTNGLENFWSLLKRGLHGTYDSVVGVELFRYIDERDYPFKNRKVNDSERFDPVMRGTVGKRLAFDQLTGRQEAYR